MFNYFKTTKVVYKKMKKILLLLLLFMIFTLTGCQGRTEKYDECLRACGSGRSKYFQSTSPYLECKNICIEKYK